MLIVSDIHGLERQCPPGAEVITFSSHSVPARWPRNIKLLTAATRADYLIIHFAMLEIVFFAVLLLPFRKCRIVTLDFFVAKPPVWQRPLFNWSLGRIFKLLVYFRDSTKFQQLYGLRASAFEYIPFKVNSWEKVQKACISDQGYIFVGGRSRRDFAALFEAVKGAPWPVKLLTAREPDLTPHGSSLAGLRKPDNVEIFYNDSDSDYFVELMSGARLVVLPILKDTRIQAGIGVYLMGMALRKCVIISEAPGVSDVLLDGQACIVPPGDATSLREAISCLWQDDKLRDQYAEAGFRYATPLGGEDHLRRSILRAIGLQAIGVTETGQR